MTDAPTPRQALFLWAAIAQGGDVAAKGVKPELDKKDRDALVRLRLIATRQVGRYRSVHVEVTDRGWAWAGANGTAPLPKTGSAGGLVLHHILGRISRYLAASGVTLAELISPPSDPEAAPADLAVRIRAAYLAETDGAFGRRARLSALRHRLAEIGRGELDRGLAHMTDHRHGILMAIENPADIEPADSEAAVTLGGSAKHILILEP